MSSARKGPIGAFFRDQAFDIGLTPSPEGGELMRLLLEKRHQGSENTGISGGKRLDVITALQHTFSFNKRYSVAAFDMRAIHGNEIRESLYALLLWSKGRAVPDYVLVGGSFSSQDGEYREYLTPWDESFGQYDRLSEAEEARPPEERYLSLIEEKTLELVRDGQLALQLTVYGEKKEKARIVRLCDESRFIVRLFVGQTLLYHGLCKSTVRPPHMHPDYEQAMESVLDEMHDVLPKDLTKDYTLAMLQFGRGDVPSMNSAEKCGLKVQPLMMPEVTQPNNIRYSGWREVWISQLVSDLVLNGRTNTFPYWLGWMTVLGVNETLYDNEAMQRHYITSRAAEASLLHLNQARRGLIEVETEGNARKMTELDLTLHESSVRAEEMVVSDIALLTASQNVGDTLGTAIKIPRSVGDGYIGDNFETVLFQWMYSCLVLHDVAIHGDLHINNVTVRFDWTKKDRHPPNPSTLYIAGPAGERDSFLIPMHGLSGFVIDFSRALVNPAMRNELVRTMGDTQTEAFFREQAGRTVRTVGRWEETFARKYEKELKGAALMAPQELYDALTAIDFMVLGRNVAIALRTLKSREGLHPSLQVADSVIERCEMVREVAHEELLRGLHEVILHRKSRPRPGLDILKRCFPHRLLSNLDPSEIDKVTLMDVLNANAPMRFNGPHTGTMDNFPPWGRIDTHVRVKGSVPREYREGERRLLLELLRRGETDIEFELAAEKQRAQMSSEKVRPPPDAARSWLD